MEDWSVFTGNNKLQIFQKYIGEIRFGPMYVALKSNPAIEEFNNKIFGDWFYLAKNGIFLQEWNSLKKPDTNLIFIHFDKLKFQIIQKNISSVFWKMKEDDNSFSLDINDKILELKINKSNLD